MRSAQAPTASRLLDTKSWLDAGMMHEARGAIDLISVNSSQVSDPSSIFAKAAAHASMLSLEHTFDVSSWGALSTSSAITLD